MNYDELLKRLPKAKNMADGYALYQRYLQDRFDKEKQEYVPNQMPRDDVQKYTSRILALYQLSEEAKEKKSNVDFKETDGKKRFDEILESPEFEKRAENIRNNPIFHVVVDSTPELLSAYQPFSVVNMSKRINTIQNYYIDSVHSQKKAQRMLNTVEALNNTGVRVGGNSARYTDALNAMRAMTNLTKNHTPGETVKSVTDTIRIVKDYLSDKATVRKTKTGRIRFENCMKFLHDHMLPDEFKKYCDDINRQRDVKKTPDGKNFDPNDKNFISPEQFGPQRTANEVVQDIKDKVNFGLPMTKHDAALVKAAYELSDTNQGYLDLGKPIDPVELGKGAEVIEKDKDFIDWIGQKKYFIYNGYDINSRDLQYLLEKDPA